MFHVLVYDLCTRIIVSKYTSYLCQMESEERLQSALCVKAWTEGPRAQCFVLDSYQD